MFSSIPTCETGVFKGPAVHHDKILKIIINQIGFAASLSVISTVHFWPRKRPPLGEERRPVIQTLRLGLERGLQGRSEPAVIDAADIVLAGIPVADV